MDVFNGLRKITVLFIKLSNGFYNYLTKEIDVPALNQAVQTIQSVVYQYEGYLKFLVDDKGCIVICAFGPTPYSHDDDCVRGVFTALKMRDILQKNNQISSFVGVTTGHAFCGWVGSEERREYTIVGDVVNLSARLMAAAEKLSVGVLCDSDTFRSTKKLFEYDELPPILVKGKSEPQLVFVPVKNLKERTGKSSRIGVPSKLKLSSDLLLDTSSFSTRKSASYSGIPNAKILSPSNKMSLINHMSVCQSLTNLHKLAQMIGRQRERQAIHQSLNSLRYKGAGGALVVEGDAGIGKTMLLGYAFENASELDLLCVAGQCEALEQSPLLIWRAIFSQLFEEESRMKGDKASYVISEIISRKLDLDAEISDGTNLFKIRTLLPLLNPIFRLSFPVIKGEVNGLSEDSEWRNLMIFELLLSLLKSLTCEVPGTVIILDNAQWMDSVSVSFTLELSHAQLPILLLIGVRPSMDGHSFYELPSGKFMRLIQMPAEECKLLIKDKLRVQKIPEKVYSFVINKAQGNPLLCDELLAQLRNLGALEINDDTCTLVKDLSQIKLSNSIQGLITSKIDALPPGPVLVLQVASVIGREFDLEILSGVFPIPINHTSLMRDIDELIKQEIMITTFQTLEEEEDKSKANQRVASERRLQIYNVKHTAIYEICYSIMSFTQRLQLHRQLTRWYEAKAKEVKKRKGGSAEVSSLLPILAHHTLKVAEHREAEAEWMLKAIQYLTALACEGYEALCRVEAVRSLQRAEVLMARLPPNVDCPQRKEVAFMKRLLSNEEGSAIRRGLAHRRTRNNHVLKH
eukprot:TRINITY_DN647_c0_g2_i1.p1 TRINITY_DN647_c0_g2~~TRINITY_DN647_c0_g2_i1.p1  ORF type:complete len:853 (+),score=152.84 TRINITY_DN647_c0_g2_i1:154-2559(+)